MARLPVPGSDRGVWGDILNAYLRVEHSSGGFHPDASGSGKGFIRLTRDLGNSANTPYVVGLQGRNVASTAPNDGEVLAWNAGNGRWEPQVSAGSVVDADGSTKGIVRLADDLGGTADNPRVAGIQGYSVQNTPPSGNQTLVWSSLNSRWEPGFYQDAAAGVNGILRLTNDLGGTAASPVVTGLQGRALATTAPTDGQALVWNNTATQWEPADVSGGGGGAMTVQIAAANATDEAKAKADLVCTGTNDHTTIYNFVNPLTSAFNVHVKLSEGTFVLGGMLDLSYCTVEGADRVGTIIQDAPGFSDSYLLFVGTAGAIRDLTVSYDFGPSSSAEAAINLAGGNRLHNINVYSQGTGVVVTGWFEGLSITDSYITASFYGVDLGVNYFRSVLIQGNYFDSCQHAIYRSGGVGENMSIINNTFNDQYEESIRIHKTVTGDWWPGITIGNNTFWNPFGAIYISSVASGSFVGCSITGNAIAQPGGVGTSRIIRLENMKSWTVSGNSMAYTSPGHEDILLVGCDSIIVSNNSHHASARNGIRLTNSRRCLVKDNRFDYVQSVIQADNTYDGILLDGDSDENNIVGNKITSPASTNRLRYGINISVATCDANVVVGNDLRPSANFVSGTLNDTGTGTVTSYGSSTLGDNFDGTPAPSSGGGNAPTIVVAADNASAESKARADLICNGTNDEVIISQAIDSLVNNGQGGKLVLSEGDFDINITSSGNPFSTLSRPITVQGMGPWATSINLFGGIGSATRVDLFYSTSIGCVYRDFAVNDYTDYVGGVNCFNVSGDYSFVQNIYAGVSGHFITADGAYLIVTNNIVEYVGNIGNRQNPDAAIDINASAGMVGLQITNNYFGGVFGYGVYNDQAGGNGVYPTIISDNIFEFCEYGGVYLEPAFGVLWDTTITDNIFEQCGGYPADAAVALLYPNSGRISGNHIENCSGGGIYVYMPDGGIDSDEVNLHISDNTIGRVAGQPMWLHTGVNVDTGFGMSAATRVNTWAASTVFYSVQGAGGTNEACAQSFTLSVASDVYSFSLPITWVGQPGDSIRAKITSSLGGASVADSLAIPGWTLWGNYDLNQWNDKFGTGNPVVGDEVWPAYTKFVFPAVPNLAPGTYYVEIERTGARDTSNYYQVIASTTSTVTGGAAQTSSSGVWTPQTGDLHGILNRFLTYTNMDVSIIGNKINSDNSHGLNTVRIDRGCNGLLISSNKFLWCRLTIFSDDVTVSSNSFSQILAGSGGNFPQSCLTIAGSRRNHIANNSFMVGEQTFIPPGYPDCVIQLGGTEDCFVTGNMYLGGNNEGQSTGYAPVNNGIWILNTSGTTNRIVGNDMHLVNTNPILDDAPGGSILTYPNDPTLGDNW